MKYTYQKDGYKPTTEIFVFGSNLSGIHGAGAAKEARYRYGAIWGRGTGIMGRSYAIPTKDRSIDTLPLLKIKPWIDEFIKFATDNPTMKFYVSRIGCGYAGYDDYDIAPLFRSAPTNCSFAENWKEYLEPTWIDMERPQ
jgi:hypothetical protein